MIGRALPSIVALLLLFSCAPDRETGTAGSSLTAPHDETPLRTEEQAVTRRCGVGPTLPGIDVSYYQGEPGDPDSPPPDWDRVAADGVYFAYMRVSDGLNTRDTAFTYNWQESRGAGVYRGAYQYFRPSADAAAQAQLFIDAINNSGGFFPDDLPPMIDVETMSGRTAAEVRAGVRTWIDLVEAEFGKRPIIYTGSYFWDDNGLGTGFADYPVWTAHYTTNPCPLVADPWSTWTIWQYSDSGTVDGIEGGVDVNFFNGDEEAFAAWAEIGPPSWWCEPIDALTTAGIFDAECNDFDARSTFSLAQIAGFVSTALRLETSRAWSDCAPSAHVADLLASYERALTLLAALEHGDGRVALPSPDGFFDPESVPTRCQAAVLVAEAWDLPDSRLALSFSDLSSVPSDCLQSLTNAVAAGVVSGGAGAFRPNDAVTVGEVAVMLNNAIVATGQPLPDVSDFNDASCRVSECDAICTSGQRQCAEDGFQECVVDAEGCAVWTPTQPCAAGQRCGAGGLCFEIGAAREDCGSCVAQSDCADGYLCANQLCSRSCESTADCRFDHRCNLASSTCEPFIRNYCDGNSVLAVTACGFVLGAIDECSGTEICSDGACSIPCINTCSPGATQCLSDTEFSACSESDAGCYLWSAPTACQANEFCERGQCLAIPPDEDIVENEEDASDLDSTDAAEFDPSDGDADSDSQLEDSVAQELPDLREDTTVSRPIPAVKGSEAGCGATNSHLPAQSWLVICAAFALHRRGRGRSAGSRTNLVR